MCAKDSVSCCGSGTKYSSAKLRGCNIFNYSITNREVFLRPSKHDETSWNPYETMLPEKLPPMLILQGTMDSVVGMSTVRSYFEKLVREQAKKSDDLLVLLEGGRHAFDYMLSESTFVAANGVSAWLHRNLF